jgi:Protein of unknown function (DUF3048).
LTVVAAVTYAAVSCGKQKDEPTAPTATAASKPVESKPAEKTVESTSSVKQPGNLSPYTGIEISEEALNNIPYMVIIENSTAARPQSGISKADIVFETIAEAGIPRLMALFHSESPKEIGPVRSARPYFLMLSKEFGLPFAHCGASEEASNIIKKEKLMSMNEFYNGKYYWRDQNRKAPHNLYTSAEKITQLISNKGYVQQPVSFLKFSKEFWDKVPNTANKVDIKLSTYSGTTYEFKNGLYYKYMDNVKTVDKSDNSDITVSNIVVQITSIKAIDSYGRLKITQIGEGKGYVVSGGKYMNIKWSKKDEKSPTILTDESGNEVSLSPGKTWWHITDENIKINFE